MLDNRLIGNPHDGGYQRNVLSVMGQRDEKGTSSLGRPRVRDEAPLTCVAGGDQWAISLN